MCIFFGGKLMYISKGNKMTGTIPTFSLPTVITCPGATDFCKKVCYARVSERIYQHVLKRRIRNLWQILSGSWVPKMIEIIKERNIKYFRIHEAGELLQKLLFTNICE